MVQTRIPIIAVDVNELVISVPKPAIKIKLVRIIALPVRTVDAVSAGIIAFLRKYSIRNLAR